MFGLYELVNELLIHKHVHFMQLRLNQDKTCVFMLKLEIALQNLPF